MREFEELLPRALTDANLAQFRRTLEQAETREPNFSPRYLRSRLRMINDPVGWMKRRARSVWQRAARSAACILLACAVALGSLMAVSPSIRAAVLHWVREITEGGGMAYRPMDQESKLPPSWRPAWLPEGWYLGDILAVEDRTRWTLSSPEPVDGLCGRLHCTCYSPGSNGVQFSSDQEYTHARTTVQGVPADYYENDRQMMLFWESPQGHLLSVSLSGRDRTTLERIAESMTFYDGTDIRYEMDWLPEEDAPEIQRFENIGVGQIQWFVRNDLVTFQYITNAPCPMTSLERASEEVSVNGLPARYWPCDLPEEETGTGQQVPGSILYTDAAGGKTNYLPIRAISELLGVEVGYDSATQTVLLGDQSKAQTSLPAGIAPANARWTMTLEDGSLYFRSEDGGVKHSEPPAYRPVWQAEGWGLSEIRGRSSFASWIFQNGGSRIDFLCSFPGGSIGCGTFADPEKAVQNRRQLTIQDCAADLYTEGKESLLVWENGGGLLFRLIGKDVAAETLIQAAESVRPCGQTAGWKAGWLPEGVKSFDRSAVGDTRQEVWMVKDTSLTLLASPCPMAAPEDRAESVKVNGRTASFWAAKRAAEPQPVETQTVGGVTITAGVVAGFGAADMNTLVWSDPDSGMNFCLLGALDRDTMVRIAESVGYSQ